ncbi:MAG: type II toxin-antitoxin system HicA family toxin [Brevundimonas sp.]|nr:MAG: type II toxin-antitoxin system HicA family toxin [Brevundimonas sp.]
MGKRLEAMRANPFDNWRIADVEAVCAEFDVGCEPVRGGGSHYKVSHPKMKSKPSIPFARPIKPVYIRQLIRFLDEVAKLS